MQVASRADVTFNAYNSTTQHAKTINNNMLQHSVRYNNVTVVCTR